MPLKLPRRVSELMSPNPKTVAPDTTVADAYQLIFEGGFRHIPIVDGGRAVGMISDRDILKHMPPPSKSREGMHDAGRYEKLQVREIMSHPPLLVLETDQLDVAIEVMISNQVSAVVAADAQDRVKGILTLVDVANAFLAVLEASP